MDHNTSSRVLSAMSTATLLFVLGCLQSPVSWSPDGKRVAFVQVREAPGENQLPQLSDGKHLVELWVADVESEQGEIIDAGQGGLSAPAWSPDGRTIAYLRIDVKAVPQKQWKELYDGPGFRADVVLYDVTTKSKRVLCETFVHPSATTHQLVIYTASLQPSWSPDGKLLAFDDFRTFSFPNVMVANMSGKKRVLAQGCAYPRWSPDGKLVACVLGLPVRLTHEKRPIKIVLVKPDGTVQRMIDAIAPPQSEGTYWGRIAWAPDSRRIAYVGSAKDGSTDCSVFVARVEGEPELLASGDKERIPSNPAWGPDPGSITVRWGNQKACRIVTLDLQTKRETLLSDKDLRNAQFSISATALGWFPDGKWLAHRWYGGVVRLLSRDGSTEKVLDVDAAAARAVLQAHFDVAEQAVGQKEYSEARKYAEKAVTYADEFLRRFSKDADPAAIEKIQVLKADALRLMKAPDGTAEQQPTPADPATRAAEVKELGKKGDAEAMGELVLALADPNPNTREDTEIQLDKLDPQWRQSPAVAEALKKIAPPLAGQDWRRKLIVAGALGRIRHRSSIAPLIEALRSYSPELRQEAAKSLQQIDPNWRKSAEAEKAVSDCLADLAGPSLSSLTAYPERCRFIMHYPTKAHPRPGPKDDKSLIRGGAAHALGELKASQAVEPMIAALKDQDRYVGHSAAQALGKIGDRRAVDPLIAVLGDDDWFLPAAAACALGEIREPKAVEPLIDTFKVKDGMIALRLWPAAATALGQIGDRRAIGSLVFALGDWYARAAALEALNKIDPNWHTDEAAVQAVQRLVGAADHWDSRRREQAIEGLCKIRNRQAFEAMLTLVRKGHAFTKESAEAYGKMGEPWVIEPLLEAAKGTDYGARRAALQILQHSDDPRTLGALIDIMGSSSLRQQDPYREAKKILDEKFPDWRASKAATRMVEKCTTQLNDPDNEVRYWASILIREIAEPRRDKAHGKPASTNAVQPDTGAADWRSTSSAKETIQKSTALLKDKDWKVQIGAILALGELRAREALPALIDLAKCSERRDLGDAVLYEQWSVRDEAIVSLGMIGDPRAVDVLIDLLDSQSEHQRAAAIALAGVPDRRSVEPLIRALRSTSSSVRQMAARALGAIRDPRAVRPLVGVCGDDEWEVRDAATKALAAIGNAEAEEALVSLVGEKSEYAMRLLPEYAETLVRLDHPSLIETLVGMLKHCSTEIRHAAALVLEKKKDRRAIGPLIGLLADKAVGDGLVKLLDSIDPNWRMTKEAREAVPELIEVLQKDSLDTSHLAAAALGAIKDRRAVEPLIDVLGTSKWSNVKSAAITALGEIGDPRAIEPLIRLVPPTYPSPDNELIVAALKKVTGQNFGVDRKQWKIWWEKNRETFGKQ